MFGRFVVSFCSLQLIVYTLLSISIENVYGMSDYKIVKHLHFIFVLWKLAVPETQASGLNSILQRTKFRSGQISVG